jgi:hypothetical protein
MKRILPALAILLFASAAFAQSATPQPATAPGCGPDSEKFDVKSDDRQHPTVQPEDGKALVYFLQDDKAYESHPRPTTKWGMDGAWVGATQSNAYFYLSVDPGEHHLCAIWQTNVALLQGKQAAAAHFTAVAGEAYCFIGRDIFRRESGFAALRLEPLDTDEGQLLMSKFAFSTFQPKK